MSHTVTQAGHSLENKSYYCLLKLVNFDTQNRGFWVKHQDVTKFRTVEFLPYTTRATKDF